MLRARAVTVRRGLHSSTHQSGRKSTPCVLPVSMLSRRFGGSGPSKISAISVPPLLGTGVASLRGTGARMRLHFSHLAVVMNLVACASGASADVGSVSTNSSLNHDDKFGN